MTALWLTVALAFLASFVRLAVRVRREDAALQRRIDALLTSIERAES